MKITITFDELDLQDNLVLSTITNLFNRNKTIVGNIDDLEDLIPPHQQKPQKSTENAQKSKGKTKEERLKELCDFANSKWKSLNEKEQKSLKKFVEFYKKKINEENFTINVEKQLQNWFERDRNLK